MTAHESELRIEAHREDASLLLLGDGSTLTLTVSGPQIAVGAREVLRLITGVYEEDSDEAARGGSADRSETDPAAPPASAHAASLLLPAVVEA